MRKFGLFLLFIMSLLIFVSCSDVSIEREDIIIDMQDVGANISSNMYGVFFEEINHAGDGGLYAELIQNRSFNENDMPYGYYAKGDTLFPRPVKNHLTERYRCVTINGKKKTCQLGVFALISKMLLIWK